MNLFKKMGLWTDGETENQGTATTEVVENVKPSKQTKQQPEIKKPLFADIPTIQNPSQIVGAVDEKVYQQLSEAIERNNLPGNDFLEFMMSLQNLTSMAVDEKVKFTMVFTTLNATSDKMSKEKLLSSIDHYLGVIEKEKNIFANEMSKATDSMVTAKEQRIKDIGDTIQNKLDLIKQTQKEIDELTASSSGLNIEVAENQYKISKKEADFTTTSNQILNQIMSYKQKIEQYIS